MTQDIATLGLRVDATQVRDGDRALDNFERTAGRTAATTETLSKKTDILARIYRDLAAAFAAVKLAEYIKDAALLAARYETLGVTMGVVGKQAGYTAVQMEAAAVALQKTGISMIESRQQAMRLVQAHIDLSNATKLARIAQDAAVIGNMNSSDAFAALVHGIQSGQTEVLRTIGLNISMENSYKAIALELHKNVANLTQNEKTQGILNSVMAAGADIAGVYAASMDTAGKQLLSLKRYTEDLKVLQGEVFNEVLTVAVMAYTAHLKDANGEISEMAKNGDLKKWGQDLAQMFVSVANAIDNVLTGIKMVGTWAAHQSAGSDINKKFLLAQVNAPKKATLAAMLEQGREIEAQRLKALADEQANYEASQVTMAGLVDRFQTAFDQRQAAKADKEVKAIKATEDHEKQLQNIMAYYAGQREKGLISEKAYLAAVAGTMQAFTGDNHKYADTAAGPDAGAAKALKVYDDLIKSIKEKTAASALDEQTQGKLTEGQKFAVKIMEDLRTGTLKLSDAQKKNLAGNLETYLTQERLTAARDADTKAQKDAAEKSEKETTAIWDQARAMQQQVEMYGLSAAAALNLEAVRLQSALSTPELTAIEMSALEQRLAAVRALARATQELDSKNFVKKQAEDARQAWQKTADAIENALTTALMNGFTSGKGFAVSARDSIVAMFQTMVLRPGVQAIGQAGASMASQALGAASGTSSLLGAAGSAGTLYNAFTSSTLGQFMSGFSGSAGAASQALGAPMTGAAQAGSYASQAAPFLGAAAGAYAGYNVGERVGGVGGAVAGTLAGAGTVAVGGMVTGALAGTGMMAGATQALAALGPWGWAAIAGLAIIGSMQSGPEEHTRLGFGSNNAAGAISINERGNEGKSDKYVAGTSSEGAFGSFGVVSTFWMEAAQPAVQSFVKTVTQTDDALSKFMNSTEQAATIAALSGHTMTSNSGAEGSDPNGLGGLDAVFRDRINTIMQAVDPALGKLLDGFTGTSQELGSEATALLDYRKNLPGVSEAIFGVVATVQDLVALRNPTELMGTALVRVTSAFQATNAVIDSFGVSAQTAFGVVGLASMQARQRLIDLAGGVDALTAGAGYFAQNFLSQADQLAPVVDALTHRMSDLGYAGVATADGYRDAVVKLVESGQLATAEGAKTYIELLKLAPGFKQVGDAAAAAAKVAADAAAAASASAVAAAKALSDTLLGDVDNALSVVERVVEREKAAKQKAHEIAMRAIEQQITAATAALEKTRTLAASLHSTLDSMKAPNGAANDRKSAQAQIAAALAIARAGGPLPAAGDLQKSLATVAQDSSALFATYEDYQRDFYTTANDIAGLADLTDTAATAQEKMLVTLEAQKTLLEKAFADEMAALDAQVENARTQTELLKGMDTSLLSISQAMAALAGALMAAQQNPALAATAGITGAYKSALGRAPDAAGLGFWQGQAAAGGSLPDIISAISNSPEAKIQALYKSTLGRTADAAGLQFWVKQLESGSSLEAIRSAFVGSDEYKNVPHFAAGGDHAGGWRKVGERGVEMEYTGPSAIVSHADAKGLLDQSGTEREIRALRQEMISGLMTIARHTGTVAKLQEQFDRDGTPQPRNEGATA